ncbi:MFS transporter [Anaerocolumna chitinilytica]|uniref:MFS transporter n=1 Tax=Anaerocolumna chitinilytica TaxID=1727145 RepID=A0A7M3S977_9FIRM|nr:MFS transporter [Anaerocolumna chitinilytica]BCK01145.1 MFS transporter [Anaerocolumna chitinilytica]
MVQKKHTTLILVLFLLGIFMGAIDNGIVSPAREIIQNSFSVSKGTGAWMITIYTLVYAVSMPISSKLSDTIGRKRMYIFGIAVFGIGSALCGFSNFYGNFAFLLTARVIQAIGAGGILPIATTVIGQSFPPEKRGTALGLVGAVYGVATIVGPTLGSTIIDLAGQNHWGFIFFINVPICIVTLCLSRVMEESRISIKNKLDIVGAVILAAMIASLLYALTNMNFFDVVSSLQKIKVYPFLIAFIVLIPVFILAEKRAADPVLSIRYFKNREILTIFIIAFIVGIGMMGMVYMPQFAENTLKLRSGSGGYLVTLLAVFSGVASPLSGKLLDKKGAKLVLMIGFFCTVAGTLVLGLIAAKSLTFISVLIGIAFMGFGVGFTMGPPLNYLILGAVKEEEGATALATMSLVRSIGVTISPSFMIGFIVDASKNIQSDLMQTLQVGFSKAVGGDMLAAMGSNGSKGSENLFASLQNADVTTIVSQLTDIFKKILPEKVQPLVLPALSDMSAEIEKTFQHALNLGYTHMFIASAIIAALGIAVSLTLKSKKKLVENSLENDPL